MSTPQEHRGGSPAAAHSDTRPRHGLFAWLESRTGLVSKAEQFLDEKIPGGARWAYVFGSLLLLVLANQVVTGLLLMAFFAPSATDAWASVAYVQDQLPLGWFVRGMHSAGSSILVLGLLGHMLQVVLSGAYRAPREINWWSGIVAAGLIMAFALTGYLLPWDQKGYWATQVATTLLGAIPAVGAFLQAILQGGSSYGNLTLTHFYSLHVFVLPVLLGLVLLLHLIVFRRHGVTPRWHLSDEELHKRAVPFWPRQAVYDLAAGGLLLLVQSLWVVRTHGAGLSAPADPSVPFDARPEWYFLPLFQLLKYCPPALEVAAAVVAPLLFLGALALMPWLDKAQTRDPRERGWSLLIFFTCIGSAGLLGGLARLDDLRDAEYKLRKLAAHEEAVRARQLALEGVPAAGGTAVFENDPRQQGRALFRLHCAGCHRLGSLGPSDADLRGPVLTGLYSRGSIAAFLQAPDAPTHFGSTPLAGAMKPVNLPAPELAELTEYLYGLSGPPDLNEEKRRRGEALFLDKNCDLCHERDGKTEGTGPNLLGFGSADWIRSVLVHPGSPLRYGDKNDMPAFGKKLEAAEIERLVLFLRAEQAASSRR